ncbi:MAG: hypothetical protein OEV40_19500 [Acidimicrobiia bacterium]|nr:hypothetical protein [Acidimicrobiia bacterium]
MVEPAQPSGRRPVAPRAGPGLRSTFAFGSGVVLFALGIATVASQITPLSLGQTLSVAALAAGVVLLIALLAAPRR